MLAIADTRQRQRQESCQRTRRSEPLTVVRMPRIARAKASPADRLARDRFLALVDQLVAERGVSERALAREWEMDETHIPQIRRDPERSIGGTVQRRVCEKESLSADYFAASDGDYRQFLRTARQTTPEDDEAWALFIARHKASLSRIEPIVVTWIREAPFRGGPSRREHGWSLALDAALALSGGKLPLDEVPAVPSPVAKVRRAR